MKEARDSRYHGRISSIAKARWEAASKQQGYRNLSLFIEEAVEEKIEGGAHESTATPPTFPTGPTGPMKMGGMVDFFSNANEVGPPLSLETLKVNEVLVREFGKPKQYGTDFKKTPDKKKRW